MDAHPTLTRPMLTVTSAATAALPRADPASPLWGDTVPAEAPLVPLRPSPRRRSRRGPVIVLGACSHGVVIALLLAYAWVGAASWRFPVCCFALLTAAHLAITVRELFRLKERNAHLERSMVQVQQSADRDDLTLALTRRRFMELLDAEVRRSARTGASFCVVLLDVDWFKAINDRHGHMVGDRVLRELCALLAGCLRSVDSLGRFGGEEFVMLLLGVSQAGAPLLVQRMLRAIRGHDWNAVAPGLMVRASMGVAAWRHGDDVLSLLNRADAALYAAKNAGRDRAEYAGAAG